MMTHVHKCNIPQDVEIKPQCVINRCRKKGNKLIQFANETIIN